MDRTQERRDQREGNHKEAEVTGDRVLYHTLIASCC